MKKILSGLLTLLMLVSVFPATAVSAFALDYSEMNIQTDLELSDSEIEDILNDISEGPTFITDMRIIVFSEGSGIVSYAMDEGTINRAFSAAKSGKFKADFDESFPYGCENWTTMDDGGEAADFNQDTGMGYMSMIYQNYSDFIPSSVPSLSEETQPYSQAITDIVTSSECADTITHNGIEYERVLSFICIVGMGDIQEITTPQGENAVNLSNLNCGLWDSTPIYMYVTRDAGAGNPITRFFFQGGSGHSCSEAVCDLDGNQQDFNADTGDDACYLWFDRYGSSKSEIASAIEQISENGGIDQEPVNYRSADFDGNEVTYTDETSDTYLFVQSNENHANWGITGAETWYVLTGNQTISNGVSVRGDVHLILSDGSSLTVTGGGGKAGINVPKDSTLTIYGQEDGTGKITASGGNDDGGAAAIGGNAKETNGDITINGGTIVATGSMHGAGIGGGVLADHGGNLTINGGTISAKGNNTSAGIGGGWFSSGADITINGGEVKAIGGPSGAAGIGGGAGNSSTWGGDGHHITINGGNVTAEGGGSGAGIGGGADHGDGFQITITGGVVKATAGEHGAGIGGGFIGDGVDITITGGEVTATGNNTGAGIGGGWQARAYRINIEGGKVMAIAGAGSNNGIGRGANGGDCEDIYISTDMQIQNAANYNTVDNDGGDLSSKLEGIRELSVEGENRVGSVISSGSVLPVALGGGVLILAGIVFILHAKKKKESVGSEG